MPLRLFIEHQDSDHVKRLEHDLAELRTEVEGLRRQVDDASRKALYELYVNNELIDILRANGIHYRPSAKLKDSFERGEGV